MERVSVSVRCCGVGCRKGSRADWTECPQTNRRTRTIGSNVHAANFLQPHPARTDHGRGPRQHGRVRETRKHGALRQPDPKLALQAAYNVLRFGPARAHEEGFYLVDLPLLGLRSGDIGLFDEERRYEK